MLKHKQSSPLPKLNNKTTKTVEKHTNLKRKEITSTTFFLFFFPFLCAKFIANYNNIKFHQTACWQEESGKKQHSFCSCNNSQSIEQIQTTITVGKKQRVKEETWTKKKQRKEDEVDNTKDTGRNVNLLQEESGVRLKKAGVKKANNKEDKTLEIKKVAVSSLHPTLFLWDAFRKRGKRHMSAEVYLPLLSFNPIKQNRINLYATSFCIFCFIEKSRQFAPHI